VEEQIASHRYVLHKQPRTRPGYIIIIIIIIITIYTLGINVPEGGLKKLEKMKRLGMSIIPRGHKREYFHVEVQR